MKRKRDELLAGLFILACLVAGVVIVALVRGVGKGSGGQTVVARFPLNADLGGLREGNDVRLGGARSGTVLSVMPETLDNGDTFVAVQFTMPRRFTLRQDAIVRINKELTGSPGLNIEAIGSGAPLKPGEFIIGRAAGLNDVIATLGEIAPEVRGLVVDIRKTLVPRAQTLLDRSIAAADETKMLMADVRARIEPAVKKYDAVADRSAEAMSNLRDVFGETKGDFRETMASINKSTATLRDRIPTLLDRVTEVTTSLKAALESVNATATNARDASGTIREVILGNKSKLDAIIASVSTTGENLENASSEIRRSPWRLLYQPKESELANLNLFDSARQFANGARALSSAAAALRDAAQTPGVDPKRVEQLVGELEASMKKFAPIEKALFDKVRKN